MKSCEYCGKQYDDDIAVCPIDGQPVTSQEERQEKTATQSEAVWTAFDVRLVSPISAAGTYRVFVERNDLIFILIEGGTRSVLEAVVPLLGPFGGLIPLSLWFFTKRKAKLKLEQIKASDPEQLLRESDKNFRLHLAEIRDAAIEAPTFFCISGKAGRLIFTVRHDEKIKMEFIRADEVKAAIHLLTPLLHSTLQVNVEWDERKQRFQQRVQRA